MAESGPKDFHHILYPAARYTAPANFRLREFPLVVVQLPISTHIELHRQLEPSCILLTRQTVEGAYHELGRLASSSCVEPLEVVDALARWLREERLFDLAANLLDQQGFLEEATPADARVLAKRQSQQAYHKRKKRA